MRVALTAVVASLFVLGAGAGSAHAQGALVAGSVSAAVSNNHTSPSYGGSVTWRFNRVLGFGVEATHTTGLAESPSIYCCTSDKSSRLTTFTTNVRVEIPTISARVIPFVIGGGGMAALTTRATLMFADTQTLAAQLAAEGLGAVLPLEPGPIDVESTSTQMALTLGGGASFLVTRHVSIDVDMRVLHLMGDSSRDIGRFGLGVSYRF